MERRANWWCHVGSCPHQPHQKFLCFHTICRMPPNHKKVLLIPILFYLCQRPVFTLKKSQAELSMHLFYDSYISSCLIMFSHRWNFQAKKQHCIYRRLSFSLFSTYLIYTLLFLALLILERNLIILIFH